MEGTNNLTQMLEALRHKAEHENIGIIIVGGTPKEAHFLGAASRNDLLFVSTSSKSPKLNKVMQRLYDLANDFLEAVNAGQAKEEDRDEHDEAHN